MQPNDTLAQTASLMPWSVEAETGVLSALLLDNDAWDHVGDVLTAEDFYRAEHRHVFSAIAQLITASKPADLLTVFEHLQNAGKADDAGGLAYLNQIAQFIPSAANARRYAEIVAERALMRRLRGASDRAREIAVEAGLSVSERLDRCQQEFQKLAVVRGGKEPKPVVDFAMSLIDRITDLADGKVSPGVPTHIPTLDKLLGGGIKPGKQMVIAARPSVGKSAFAMELAYALADQGYAAGFLSQEMESVELVDRLTARIGRIDLGNMATGRLTPSEWESLTEAAEKLRNLPLFIDDQAGLSLSDIQVKARKLKRDHDIKLLVLDYVQLCSPSDSKASRHHQLEEISRGLKVLAKQLGITTVVLSQLNREVEKRVGGKPTLADLKESGAIEEDADVVILLSPENVRDGGDVVVHAEVAKNRGGSKGFVKLAFAGRHQRFVETIVEPNDRKPIKKPVYAEDV